MATRTIESPGVEIFETDDSLRTTTAIGTTVFATGYAKQGPSFELINITSKSELEQVYGLPTNPAERYFYQSCNEILNSNANLQTVRLPYGGSVTAEDLGEGFGEKYSGLFYPVTGFSEVDGVELTAGARSLWDSAYTLTSGYTTSAGGNMNALVTTEITSYILPNDNVTLISLITGTSANVFNPDGFSLQYQILSDVPSPDVWQTSGVFDEGTFVVRLDGNGSYTAISDTNSDIGLTLNYTSRAFNLVSLNGKTIAEAIGADFPLAAIYFRPVSSHKLSRHNHPILSLL